MYTVEKAVRRVMHLNRRTHSKLLSPICGFDNIEYTVKLRVAKFFTKMYHSDNLLVSMLAKRCLYQCTSNMGKNFTCIDKELVFL